MRTKLSILFLASATAGFSQIAWEVGLNNITSPATPDFGTSTSHCINFFTNGVKRMELGVNGKLKLPGLAGSGTRLLFTDANGNLMDNGGGFGFNGSNGYHISGARFGIGTTSPAVALHVQGEALFGNTIALGTITDQFAIQYRPGTGNHPDVLGFAHRGNPTDPIIPDPTEGEGDYTCLYGETSAAQKSLALFKDVLSVWQPYSSTNNTIKGQINMGHNGSMGYVEVQGDSHLHLNPNCNRNVFVFGHSAPFAPSSTGKVMSISGQLNVVDNIQLGDAGNIFSNPSSRFYVYASGGAPTGIKVRHSSGTGAGMHLIEVNNNSTALLVSKGSTTVDGTEVFSVKGDGKTEITSSNADALTIMNGLNSNLVTYNVKGNGNTYIAGNLGIGTQSPIEKFHLTGGNMVVDGNIGVNCLPQTGINLKIVDPGAAALFVGSSSQSQAKVSVGNSVQSYMFAVDGTTAGIGHISSGVDLLNFKASGSPAYPQVWIGKRPTTGTHTDFHLAVEGKIVTNAIYVTLAGTWADYVFDKNYKLQGLDYVKDFIDREGHLPNIPSAKELTQEQYSLNLAEMQESHMAKIEEIFLHLIDLNDQIKALKAENAALKEKTNK